MSFFGSGARVVSAAIASGVDGGSAGLPVVVKTAVNESTRSG